MQIRQMDTRREAFDMARRCSAQARYHRQEGEYAVAATFEACVMELNRQMGRMTARIELAVYEFNRWSGKVSAESNAERAGRQAYRAIQRLGRQSRQSISNWQGLIGRQCTVNIKKGN